MLQYRGTTQATLTQGGAVYNPDDLDLNTASVEELRKAYAFYHRAALYGAGQFKVKAHLEWVNPKTPIEWVKAIKSITITCERCKGTGEYSWGGTINGRPVHAGACYRCSGTGRQTMCDFRRNRGYDNHSVRRAFA